MFAISGFSFNTSTIHQVFYFSSSMFLTVQVICLRARIFSSILIRKVEFFDRYKVGELTALLTSDLGSLKSIVSDNISRDRGFRALSEASNSTLCKIVAAGKDFQA
ncbi:hypothetical protein POM88_051940 [Heracleum sosnowskyi]|uniref:ABC transmembrane type-1 domain-containing protein n=1 Tax=Heracleum sosnowskyi TaxID=360622 RepID=A0AAD8GSX3_9APIA|nr:hypothetical protein POM88_051940 [Heracleum sosnowskyi]